MIFEHICVNINKSNIINVNTIYHLCIVILPFKSYLDLIVFNKFYNPYLKFNKSKLIYKFF